MDPTIAGEQADSCVRSIIHPVPHKFADTFDYIHLQSLLNLEQDFAQDSLPWEDVLLAMKPIWPTSNEVVEGAVRSLNAAKLQWTNPNEGVRDFLPEDLLAATGPLISLDKLGILDDCLLIRSYTMNCLFGGVSKLLNNEVTRSSEENREAVLCAHGWCIRVKQSLTKLSAHISSWKYHGTVYRGIKFAYPDVKAQFVPGTILVWYTLKSATTNEALMQRDDFAGPCGPRTIFEIQNCDGVRISQLSVFEDESEILFRPGSYFKVINSLKRSNEYGDHEDGDPFTFADYVVLQHLGSDINACLKLAEHVVQSTVMMIGNPGRGKSALLNAYSKQCLFTSGPSSDCFGVTKQLGKGWADNRLFLDTPGVADAEEGARERASAAIFQALLQGGTFQVFTVVELIAGRAFPEDLSTIAVVREACRDLEDFKFCIIVNKCPPQLMGDVDRQMQIAAFLKEQSKCEQVHFAPRDDDMEWVTNKIWTLPVELRRKIANSPVTSIDPARIHTVSTQNYHNMVADFEKKIAKQEERWKEERSKRKWFWCALLVAVVAVVVMFVVHENETRAANHKLDQLSEELRLLEKERENWAGTLAKKTANLNTKIEEKTKEADRLREQLAEANSWGENLLAALVAVGKVVLLVAVVVVLMDIFGAWCHRRLLKKNTSSSAQ